MKLPALDIELCWFGQRFAFQFGPVADDEPEFEPFQDAGTTGSYPVGFAPTPMPPWDDPGGFHTLDPDDDLEDRR